MEKSEVVHKVVVKKKKKKDEIDLRKTLPDTEEERDEGEVRWETQFSKKFGKTRQEQNTACKAACDAIMEQLKIKVESPNNGKVAYQVAIERDVEYINNAYERKERKFNEYTPQDDYMMEYEEVFQAGLDYLDRQLEQGYPVMVGVDHTYGQNINNDKSTDHFVVIVGRKYYKKGFYKRLYYLFYDVGTRHQKYGASDANRLFIKGNALRGCTSYEKKRAEYFVTQIRVNKIQESPRRKQ